MKASRRRVARPPGLETIESAILLLRGERVVLDTTIAALYGVSVKQLNQAVRRNRSRFPRDFLLELGWKDSRILRSQFVTLDGDRRGHHAKYRSLAFTEQGIAMLSGVLRSPRAIRVNIEIMRAFVRLRRILTAHPDLARRLEELEGKVDDRFRIVFDALRTLMEPERAPRRRLIGFRPPTSDEILDVEQGSSDSARGRRARTRSRRRGHGQSISKITNCDLRRIDSSS
jgi:hypothetical protein